LAKLILLEDQCYLTYYCDFLRSMEAGFVIQDQMSYLVAQDLHQHDSLIDVSTWIASVKIKAVLVVILYWVQLGLKNPNQTDYID